MRLQLRRRTFHRVLLLGVALSAAPAAIAQGTIQVTEVRRILREASDLIRSIPATQQQSAVANIANLQTMAGDLPGALATVNQLPNPSAQAMPLTSVIWAMDALGDFAGALQLVASAEDSQTKAVGYHQLAMAHARRGDFEGALQIAAMIQGHPEYQVQALVVIAQQQSKAGDNNGAARTLEVAIAAVDQNRDNVPWAADLLISISAVQAEIGNRSAALMTLDRYSQIAMKGETPVEKQNLIKQLAIGQAGIGDFFLATETAMQLPHGDSHDAAFFSIAIDQAKGGDSSGAVSAAASIGRDDLREIAFGEIANRQYASGDFVGSHETLQLLAGDEQRAIWFANLALEQADKGDPNADSTLQKALEAAHKAGDNNSPRLTELIAVGRALLGDTLGAREMVADMKNPETRVWPLWNLTEIMAKSGDLQGALSLAENETDPYPKTFALLGTAKGLLDQIEADRNKHSGKK